MPLSSCPECDTRVKIPERSIGALVRCPRCKSEFRAADPQASARTSARDPKSAARRRSTSSEDASPSRSRSAESRSGKGPRQKVVPEKPRSNAPAVPAELIDDFEDDYHEEDDYDSHEVASGPNWLLIGIIALVLLGGGGGLAYWLLAGKKSDGDNTTVAENKNDSGNNQDGNNNQNNAGEANNTDADIIARKPVTGNAVYDRVIQSTAWIYYKDTRSYGWGSGALVDRPGRLVVTNYHVVTNHPTVTVFFPRLNDKKQPISQARYYLNQAKELGVTGTVVWKSSRVDLALVQLHEVPAGVLPLPIAKERASPGIQVHAVGASGVDVRSFGGALWQYVRGTVRQTSQRSDLRFQFGSLNALVTETQGAANPGDSGGPVVNDDAELVAVVQGGNPKKNDVNYNICVEEVRTAIRQYYARLGQGWVEEKVPTLRTKPTESLDSLLQKFASEDITVRRAAITAIKDLGESAKTAWPTVLQATLDSDLTVRRIAKEALDSLGNLPKYEVERLRPILKDKELRLRRYAVSQMKQIGTEARDAAPELASIMLNDSDPVLRREAAGILIRFGKTSKEVVPSLCKVLETSKDVALLELAAESLGDLDAQGEEVKKALKFVFDRSVPEVRRKAFRAMLEIDSEGMSTVLLLKTYAGVDSELADLARDELDKRRDRLGVDDLDDLRDALKTRQEKVCKFVLPILNRLGDRAEPAAVELGELLSHPDKELHQDVLETLEKMGPAAKAALPAMLKVMGEGNKFEQCEIACRVLKIEPKPEADVEKRVIKKLMNVLVPDNVTEISDAKAINVARKAVEALKGMGEPAIEELFAYLDKDPAEGLLPAQGRVNVLTTIATIGSKAWTEERGKILRKVAISDPFKIVNRARRRYDYPVRVAAKTTQSVIMK